MVKLQRLGWAGGLCQAREHLSRSAGVRRAPQKPDVCATLRRGQSADVSYNRQHAPLKQYPLKEQSLSHALSEQSDPVHPSSHTHFTFLPHEPWPEQIFCGTNSDPGHTFLEQSLPTKPG